MTVSDIMKAMIMPLRIVSVYEATFTSSLR